MEKSDAYKTIVEGPRGSLKLHVFMHLFFCLYLFMFFLCVCVCVYVVADLDGGGNCPCVFW